MGFLNLISLVGILGLCAIAWLFSENRDPKRFPWRVVIVGLLLQFLTGALVFVLPQFVPPIGDILKAFGSLLNVIFDAADAGARFVFGRNLVPFSEQDTFFLSPLAPGADSCTADSAGQVVPGFCGIRLGYVFAFRALPAVIFIAGLAALFYRIGVIQFLANFLGRIFQRLMHLGGAESLSGAANVFLGVEAAIVIRPYLANLTRSELCAILACCFGTATSATLPSYARLLSPIFPNVLLHLIAASLMAIPACFLLSKILVPETERSLATWGTGSREATLWIEEPHRSEITLYGEEPPRPLSPMEAAIVGATEGVKIAASIVAGLIMVLGLVYFVYQFMNWLATWPNPIGGLFKLFSLPNLLGMLSLPFTVLTGVSLRWEELWQCSVLIGRRFLETAIVPYQLLSASVTAGDGPFSQRAILLLSYALSGFAHLAYWGIVVGAAFALVPTRRREIIGLAWKALLAGTLATFMIACIAGFFDGLFGTDTLSVLGKV